MIEPQWQLFIVSIPTQGATLRMRIWRALKALGCAALRDGAYLLPAHVGQSELQQLLEETVKEGGNAWLLTAEARHADDLASYQCLFDRSAEYGEWLKALAQARRNLPELTVSNLKKMSRKLRRDYETIVSIDYFPNDASARAEAAWKDFAHAVDLQLGTGEPRAISADVVRLPREQYQGRTWATRQRMWVDRVASAWLIRRRIDPRASFLWLASPADCPPHALGFDSDGADFTHVGELITFQILLASFGLDQDAGLVRLGAMANSLDLGTTFVPEAAGFEAILTGAQQRTSNDDQLLAEISPVLDDLYLHFCNESPVTR